MSRPRFLADEDLRGSIARAVRSLEPAVEISSVVEQGLEAASDEEVLEFAWQDRWLIVSHDVNTMKAFAETRIADGRGIHGLALDDFFGRHGAVFGAPLPTLDALVGSKQG